MHKKITAIVLPILIVSLFAAFIVLPKKDYSERENRYLAQLPRVESIKDITDGKLTEGLSDFASDQFPLRDTWIGLNTRKSLIFGKQYINGVYFAKGDYLIEKYAASEYMENIAKLVNNFADKVDAKVSFLAVPTSSVINSDKLPKGSVMGDELLDMNILYSNLNVDAIDITANLKKVNTQSPCFYRLDHHWTIYGAMEAYKAYTKNSADFTLKLVTDSFKGTLFNKVGEAGLGSDMIFAADLSSLNLRFENENGTFRSLYDEEKLQTADKYAYFLSGNHPICTIINEDLEEGKTLLLIKDSYANCLAPLLARDYKSIILIDPRYYSENISDYVNGKNIDEVLFVYNMNMLGSDLGIRRVK